MPVVPIKNLIYRVGVTALRPWTNRSFRVQGADWRGLEKILRRRQMHRATVLVAEGNHLQLQARTGSPELPPANAYYHAASIAKMVTAIGALRLVEQGQLSLTDPITSYSNLPIPEGVTLEHLLAHTSGIKDGPAYGSAIARQIPWSELLHQEGFVSNHKPGTHFQYSNFAFGIVGCLMEEATGLTLDRYMQESLFLPHGIDATYDPSTLPKGAQIVSAQRHFPPSRGYTLDGAARLNAAKPLLTPEPLHHYGLAAGGLFITADGLMRLMQKLFVDQTFLLPDLLKSMLTPRSVSEFPGYRCGFGLGMFCLESTSGHSLYGHQGFAYGAVQGAFWSPESNQLLVSLNGGADESRRGRMGLANLDLINSLLGGGQWTL